MSDSTQPPAAPAPSPAIPVICDKCRATGMAGDEAFAAIPDILEFTPVPRRAHANGWTPEHQRAFIAALAITGSPRQACRHVGRAQFGAEQLRTAKGGRSFAAAWDAALDLARDRELARLHDNLGELARETEESNAEAQASGRFVLADPGRAGQRDRYGAEECDDDDGAYEREIEEVRERLFTKLQNLRRNTLRDEIIPDPAKRAAWIVLNGPEEIEAIEGTDPAASSSPTGMAALSAQQCRMPGMDLASSASPTPEDKAGPRLRRV